MRVAIFTDETGWHTRQVQQALRVRGAEGRCVDLADCRIDTTATWHGLVIPGYGRELPDAALVRGIAGGSFEQVTVRLGVLHALRELGVPVYNDARAIERSVDKSMTSLLLHAAGIPTPPTWAMESPAQAQRLVTGNDRRLVLDRELLVDLSNLQLIPVSHRRSAACLSGHIRFRLEPLGMRAADATLADVFAAARDRFPTRSRSKRWAIR